jgi:L-ascorbate metabolism protein UlaG (beta-lactamase superfamily)
MNGDDAMKISKFGHACLLIEVGEARILIDPGAFSSGYETLEEIDAVLVTHQHQDHVSDETLDKVRVKNPDVAVYADAGTARILDGEGIAPMKAGDTFEVKGVEIAVYGADHAVIHPGIPGIENVGYMIGGRFFYPGDSFTQSDVAVEILALPLGAPWLKVSEVVDYVMAVKPKVAIPVHDAVLAMPGMHIGIVKRFAEPQGTILKVIENGQSAEF